MRIGERLRVGNWGSGNDPYSQFAFRKIFILQFYLKRIVYQEYILAVIINDPAKNRTWAYTKSRYHSTIRLRGQ